MELKRSAQLAVSVLVALVLSFAGAGTALAQDTADDAGQNSFQSFYDDCRDGDAGDGGLLAGTGAAEWIRDSAHAGGLRQALTMPVNAGMNIGCTGVGAVKYPTDAIEAATSGFWGDPIGDFVKSLLEGNAEALALIMTAWIKESPFSGSDFSASVDGIFNLTLWAQGLLLVASLIVAGTRMAIARNRGLGDGFEDVGQLMFNFILAGAALPVVILALHQATDALSADWMSQGLGGDPEAAINAVTLIDEETGLGPAAVLILVVFALLGALAQLVALVVREGLLIVVVGLLPLAAASYALSTGKQAFKSMIGFVVAALLFKPVATLLYLAAFWLTSGNEAPSVLEAVSSMLLLAAAGLVLPALMRVVAPAVSTSVAGGSAAGIGAAAAGATGAVTGGAAAALGAGSNALSSAAGSSASGSGGSGQGAANGATYLGPHSAGGSSGSSGGGASSAPATPSGGKTPTGAGASAAPGGGGAGVSGAAATAGRGALGAAGGALGVAAAGVGAVAGVAQGAVRMTQTTEQMLDGALAAHPTPHHYR